MDESGTKYKVSNWSEYNKSLVNRGKITLWVPDDIHEHWHAKASSKPGRPATYSDVAMELCFTLKCAYRLPYRAAQGLVESLFSLGRVKLKVPCYTQVCRRANKLEHLFKKFSSHTGPIDIVLDSTGLKVYGEGEWKVRQHGISKRRTWTKLHIGMDPLSGEVVCMTLTDNKTVDHYVVEEMLQQVENPIERCFGDGAYDRKSCYEACHARGIDLITPPACNAVVQSYDAASPALKPRDAAIERIAELTQHLGDGELARKQWKYESDYHSRSVVETMMFRFKTLCGEKLFSRSAASQQQEVAIKISILNKLTSLGMPVFSRVSA